MGCTFPDDRDVDAVLLTHSHYAHDPSYYTGEGVPVFTEPGSFRAGDVELGVV
jgi:L-ascorbate metabolism protein UlaG (beta-lactamase superfamily)